MYVASFFLLEVVEVFGALRLLAPVQAGGLAPLPSLSFRHVFEVL